MRNLNCHILCMNCEFNFFQFRSFHTASTLGTYSFILWEKKLLQSFHSLQFTIDFFISYFLPKGILPSIIMQFSSIWPIPRIPSTVTPPGQSRPGSDDIEEVPGIPESTSITEATPSDCLGPGHSFFLWGGSYFSTEKKSVYSTPTADWAIVVRIVSLN